MAEDTQAEALEHEAFRGDHYQRGGMMIWGFSHHKGPNDPDGPDFTNRMVRELALTGEHWFFNRIRRFFGNEKPEQFWHKVAFANTLPTSVLSGSRYSSGTSEQRERVAGRVRRILIEFAPSKVVLFSTKGWKMWPGLNGSVGEPPQILMTSPELQHGTYNFDLGYEIKAYNLPHPMAQSDKAMIERVQYLMQH